jgi:hypothetical protein
MLRRYMSGALLRSGVRQNGDEVLVGGRATPRVETLGMRGAGSYPLPLAPTGHLALRMTMWA